MLTDYQVKIVARRRLRTALIPAVATVAVGAVLIGGLIYGVAHAQDASPAAAVQQSSVPAADFELTDTNGNSHSLSTYLADGKIVVLEWFNPQCPYVNKYHSGADANPSMREAYAFAKDKDIVWLAVNSNAPGREGSGLELNQQARNSFGIEYPLLLDESGTVGQAYGATSTPHLFIISADGEVIYNGGADDTIRPGEEASANYIVNALEQHLAGEPIEPAATPHPGCSVKYAN